MAKNIDGVLCEYEVPLPLFFQMLYLLPKDADLSLDQVRAWAEAYAEERDRSLDEALRP